MVIKLYTFFSELSLDFFISASIPHKNICAISMHIPIILTENARKFVFGQKKGQGFYPDLFVVKRTSYC